MSAFVFARLARHQHRTSCLRTTLVCFPRTPLYGSITSSFLHICTDPRKSKERNFELFEMLEQLLALETKTKKAVQQLRDEIKRLMDSMAFDLRNPQVQEKEENKKRRRRTRRRRRRRRRKEKEGADDGGVEQENICERTERMSLLVLLVLLKSLPPPPFFVFLFFSFLFFFLFLFLYFSFFFFLLFATVGDFVLRHQA